MSVVQNIFVFQSYKIGLGSTGRLFGFRMFTVLFILIGKLVLLPDSGFVFKSFLKP